MTAVNKPASQWTREECIEWLMANDPNGVYSDAESEADNLKPLTHEQVRALCVGRGAFDDSEIHGWIAAGDRIMAECFGSGSLLADGDVIDYIRRLRQENQSLSESVENLKSALRRRGVII